MKKTSLFFILIFSVFFSYHTVFAYDHTWSFPTDANSDNVVDACVGHDDGFSVFDDSTGNLVGWNGGGGCSSIWAGSPRGSLAGFGITTAGTWDFILYNSFGSSSCDNWADCLFGSTAQKNISHYHTGQYEFQVQTNSSGIIIPPNATTRIESISPTNGSTTSSTSVVVSANYYLNNPDLLNYETFPLYIYAHLHRTDAPADDINFGWSSLATATLTTITHTFTLPTNTIWELRFDLSGDGYYFISPISTPVSFNVVSDPTTGTSGYTTCSITDVAGCIQNALVYLFYPSSASLTQFNGLYAQFIHKPPFGYVVAIQEELKNLNDSGTSVFTLQTMPILNTMIFDPVRTALIWVLWVAFAFILFHRLKNIDI